jgi:hypothetical protein
MCQKRQTILSALIFTAVFSVFFAAQAHSKVVLLTSLDREDNRPPLRWSRFDINRRLEKSFRRKLRRVDVEVHHYVDQYKLYQILQRDDISAVFWVSHSSGQDRNLSAAISSVQINDFNGRDVAPLFYKLPHQLEYFALVGCQSESIFKSWQNNSRIELDHPGHLEFFLEKKKVDARRSLSRAIRQYKRLNNIELDDDELEYEEGIFVEVTRQAGNVDVTAARLIVRDELIAMFAPLKAGEVEVQEVFIPGPFARNADLKLVLDSGAGARGDTHLGQLSFKADIPGYWTLFARPDGRPFGEGAHIYQFRATDHFDRFVLQHFPIGE